MENPVTTIAHKRCLLHYAALQRKGKMLRFLNFTSQLVNCTDISIKLHSK